MLNNGWNTMRKLLLTLTLSIWFTLPLTCALLIPAAHAGPINWLKHQYRDHPYRTAFIAGGIAAGIHAGGLYHCRQGGVENCQGMYGAAWQSYAWGNGVNFAIIASTKNCWKEQPRAFCSMFGYGGTAIDAGFGINQWFKGHYREAHPVAP
jgi:hypothetical protein